LASCTRGGTGREASQPADELWRGIRALLSTMVADPDLFRAALEYIGTITPVQDILRRPASSFSSWHLSHTLPPGNRFIALQEAE